MLGQVLNYGTFRFESAGKDQALRHLTFMPDAQNLYVEVSQLLFGSDYGGAASGDDEGNAEPAAAPPLGDRQDTEPITRLPPTQS